MTDQIWALDFGEGPLVATAIHDGATVRDDVLAHMAVDTATRWREEDPYTGQWTRVAPVRIVGLRSRFEVDLNRPRENAVYRTPEDCWGIEVWDGQLPDAIASSSEQEYDAFYEKLQETYGRISATHGKFVVFDLHSYNHRRDGPTASASQRSLNPQVNVGTGTMRNRTLWAGVIERFMHDLGSFDFPGGCLDVRENVKFRGGQHARWTHETFPDVACVLAIEVKKFFMDEWTGVSNVILVEAVEEALAATVPGVLEELARLRCLPK
jgi:N-formylglutamate deformylase